MAVTLQQKAIDVIGRLPEDKIIQVIQFAEFLSFGRNYGAYRTIRTLPSLLVFNAPWITMACAADFSWTF